MAGREGCLDVDRVTARKLLHGEFIGEIKRRLTDIVGSCDDWQDDCGLAGRFTVSIV